MAEVGLVEQPASILPGYITYVDHFKWSKGLVARDWQYAMRVVDIKGSG